MCGPDNRCWRDHVLSFHKRRDLVTQERDPLNSFYLVAGPEWKSKQHSDSCKQYAEQVQIRKVHAGKTDAETLHGKEVVFQKLVQRLKQERAARDSFAVAAGCSAGAPDEVDDEELSEGGSDDDGGDIDVDLGESAAAVQITADREDSPPMAAGPSSGILSAGGGSKVTTPKRPSSSLNTPDEDFDEDAEMEDFVREHKALPAGVGRKRISTPKAKKWYYESSSPSGTSGEEEDEEEGGVTVSKEVDSAELSGMEVDEGTAAEDMNSSHGDTVWNILATKGDGQGEVLDNVAVVEAVEIEVAVLPGQQDHVDTGI